ncbi:protein kinase [Streptomyces sp. SID13666]|nr:protein kinase [Streptomyces sp. SID13666]NEA69440.1 protein kinase [Streptomyces sp. SID13588]
MPSGFFRKVSSAVTARMMLIPSLVLRRGRIPCAPLPHPAKRNKGSWCALTLMTKVLRGCGVVRTELAADPTFRNRFGREIEAARRVGGFHTASVVAADPNGEPPWLVTEYIPGPSLHDVLRRHGALAAKTVQTLAIGVADGLEGIHACGIVHRDLKSSNIIVGESLESALAMLPSHLSELVTRCLDHDPTGRPTPTEVVAQLSVKGSSAGDRLPPPVRTMVDLHNASTA